MIEGQEISNLDAENPKSKGLAPEDDLEYFRPPIDEIASPSKKHKKHRSNDRTFSKKSPETNIN